MNTPMMKSKSVLDSAFLSEEFQRVRRQTMHLCAPLAPEDTVVQSMPDASPTKWHLAHTTWFFEQFVLGRDPAYQRLHPGWEFLFNSYYQSVGPIHERLQRGMITRPSLDEVKDYRKRVDAAVQARLQADVDDELAFVVTLGLNHEQQHQELLLTDIKHLLSLNPLRPAYADTVPGPRGRPSALRYLEGASGIVQTGHAGDGFGYDSEMPRHDELLHPHAIAQRPVSNAEYAEFIRDGGYREAGLWMSEGWATVQREHWARPMYWDEDLATQFTLGGTREIDPHAPVCHVSYYEADAFARWAGARLPLEAEWEHLASAHDASDGHFADDGHLHPVAAHEDASPQQLYGDVWEWTCSPYVGYPGFRPLPGALGEYNGKFMCGQWVLRGGSCATPRGHVRSSYRNFFYPPDRWQFSGIRLARDVR